LSLAGGGDPFDGHNLIGYGGLDEEKRTTRQGLCSVRQAIHLAQKMGALLG
jgi:hypothetical protein